MTARNVPLVEIQKRNPLSSSNVSFWSSTFLAWPARRALIMSLISHKRRCLCHIGKLLLYRSCHFLYLVTPNCSWTLAGTFCVHFCASTLASLLSALLPLKFKVFASS
jgi:hypothetical protein